MRQPAARHASRLRLSPPKILSSISPHIPTDPLHGPTTPIYVLNTTLNCPTMTLINPDTLTFIRCEIADIIQLRYDILCSHRPFVEAQFEGDDSATTLHFGAFLTTAHEDPNTQPANLACVTYMLNEWQDQPAWQLRGMAVREDCAKQGIGTQLIQFAEPTLRAASTTQTLWCNARVPAIPFYERLGWSIASDEFVVPNYGPHQKMTATR